MSNTTSEVGGPKSLLPSQMRQSRVGKRPIALPKGVTVNTANGKFDVKGPKGQLSRPSTPNVKVKTLKSTITDIVDPLATAPAND